MFNVIPYTFTYLTVLFATIFICFIYSFDDRLRFDKYFLTFIKSSTTVAIPFIIWDMWFTKKGVWWFDTKYIIGYSFGGLPYEEMMFFWLIPFSCVFTYYVIDKYFQLAWMEKLNRVLVLLSMLVLFVIAWIYHDKIYTLLTAIVTIATLFYLHFIAHKKWLTKASFVYTILLPGFFAVNGVLTGTGIASPIVNYRSSDLIGFRILTIPIEDMVYGYSLILLNIYFFKLFQDRKHESL